MLKKYLFGLATIAATILSVTPQTMTFTNKNNLNKNIVALANYSTQNAGGGYIVNNNAIAAKNNVRGFVKNSNILSAQVGSVTVV